MDVFGVTKFGTSEELGGPPYQSTSWINLETMLEDKGQNE